MEEDIPFVLKHKLTLLNDVVWEIVIGWLGRMIVVIRWLPLCSLLVLSYCIDDTPDLFISQ